MSNRQVRKIDLKKIDFSTIKEQIINDDVSKMDNVKDVTPISGAKNK
jgi:choloylglycine hydrolase